MKYTHGRHMLSTLTKTLTTKDDANFLAYVEVMSVLGKSWPERFTSTEFLVLSFIIHRTLVFRKVAESISRKHFAEGIQSAKGVTCSGAGVSETSRVNALNSLCEKDYIHVHCFLDGKVEAVPRIYELNYELLVQGHDLGEIRNMLKRSRTATRDKQPEDDFYAENTPPKSSGPPLLNLGGITELLHSSKRTSSLTEEESASSTPNGPRLKVGKNAKAGAINCTTKPPVTSSAADRIAQIQADTTKARTVRVTAAKTLPARRWEIKDLQALLDQGRADAGVTVPRVMATTKGAGVLFKRMKEAEIKDALEFFTWAFQNWGTVASANRRAKAKQMKDTKASNTEMSLIPNFAELAYRFPYILAFFNDRKYTQVQEQEKVVRQKTETRALDQKQQVAIATRRDIVRQQDIEQRDKDRAAQEQRVARPMVRRSRVTVDLDETIPEYKEREWKP